jgi:hypothetical protein
LPLKIFPYEYERGLIRQMPGIFVFGDNVHHKGYKGQAIIRNLPNAYGFPTKWLPLTIPDAYFSDDDPEAANLVEKHLIEVETLLSKGNKVWWPIAGVGTGLAKWQEYAPKLLERVNGCVRLWLEHYR